METHKHQCFYCKTVWEHGDNCALIKAAHICPNYERKHKTHWNRVDNKTNKTDIFSNCLNIRKVNTYEKEADIINQPIISQFELNSIPIF